MGGCPPANHEKSIFGINDLEKAKKWYSEATGVSPYFDQPFYVGFNVGGFELGLDPNAKSVSTESAGVVAYWGVDNIEEEYQRLLSIGAKAHSKIRDVGENIKVTTVVDPFGNIFGIIYDANFKEA